MNDRLLTVEESVKAYNAGYAKDVAANLLTEEMSKRTANGKRAMLEAQRSIDIEHRNWAIADMRKQSQARIKTLIEEIQVKVMDKEGTRRAGMNWDIIKAIYIKAKGNLKQIRGGVDYDTRGNKRIKDSIGLDSKRVSNPAQGGRNNRFKVGTRRPDSNTESNH